MHLYPIDGAVHRKNKSDTAWNARDATWSMVIVGVDTDPTKFPQLRQWARDYWAAVHPFNLAGGYPNFMMDDEGRDRLEATFGDNYTRLVALKKKFDPANLFHVNQNIRSTEASDGALRNVRFTSTPAVRGARMGRKCSGRYRRLGRARRPSTPLHDGR